MKNLVFLACAALILSACGPAAPPAPGHMNMCRDPGAPAARAARFCMQALAAKGLSDPERAAAALALGRHLERLDSPGQAEAAYARALAIAPGDATAHAGRARALEALQRDAEARDAWDKAAAAAPDDMEIRAARGRFLLRRGDARGALAEFDAAARTGRRDPADTARDRAAALAAMGRSGDAETLYTLALARRPGDPELLMARAALRGLRDRDAGLADYARAAAAAPLDPAPVYAAGRLLEAKGMTREADDAYRRAWELGARDEFLAARLSGG